MTRHIPANVIEHHNRLAQERTLSEAQIRVMGAARAMLTALKGLCDHVRTEARPCGEPYLMALAAIAQAEKAGIKIEELPK